MTTESHNQAMLVLEAELDRYGADLLRWPDDRRAIAEGLLESSSSAQRLLAEAAELDAALAAAFAAPPVPMGLETRINARAERRDVWLEWLTTTVLMRPWRPLGAACVPLVLGFALGLSAAEDTADLEDSVLVAFSSSEPLAVEPTGEQ